MRIRPIVFVSVITSGLLVTPAWSQEGAGDIAPAYDPVMASANDVPEVIIHGAEPTENVAKKSKSDSGADTLSVDFPDEDVRNILRNVADLFELNLVVPDTLQGRTSIKLRDVTWRQIFDVVLNPVGFTYIEDSNIIKIVSRDSLLQEPVTTEVFILNYARAADIMPTLNPLIEPAAGGNIVIDARSNALVITERPSKMGRIRPIIEQLDKATEQVMIESKFVEVTDTDIKNIGINWSSLAGMQVGVGNISQTWTRDRGQQRNSGLDQSNDNTLTTTSDTNNGTTSTGGSNTSNNTNNTTQTGFSTTTPTNVTTPSSVTFPGGAVTLNNPNAGISTVTGAPTVQTTDSNGNPTTILLPISTTNSITTGAAASNSGTTFSNNAANGSASSASTAVNNLFGLANTGGTSRVASAVFSASDFNVIISALKQQNDTKLVSNPTVVTLNNTEAVINIGKEYPIPNYTYNQERGTYEVSGFNYRPIGIILKVTPQVNATGFIKLTLEPEVSSSNESTSFGATALPIITTRKTKTQVSLKDGFTMGIGGLIENSLSSGQTRVPVLGSIPLLGRLFRSDSKNNQSRNLIIFITAKTVSAEGATIEQVFDTRRVRQLNMRESDLPGYRDGSSAFITDEEAAAMAKKKK
jgi:type II secretory pathway component GspD/PulD (secretin)